MEKSSIVVVGAFFVGSIKLEIGRKKEEKKTTTPFYKFLYLNSTFFWSGKFEYTIATFTFSLTVYIINHLEK